MNDDVTDDRFDADLALFLERRAADVGGVRGPGEMIRAIAGGPALGAAGHDRTTRLAWLAVALALALVAATLVFVGSQRRDDLSVVLPPSMSLRPSPAASTVAVVPSASTDPERLPLGDLVRDHRVDQGRFGQPDPSVRRDRRPDPG